MQSILKQKRLTNEIGNRPKKIRLQMNKKHNQTNLRKH